MAISTIGQNGLTVPLTSNTITSASATALTLQSAGTTAVTIDTSQNVGIGTTPSSWSSGRTAVQLYGSSTAVYFAGQGNTLLTNNYYYNASDKYIANGGSGQYLMDSSSNHIWYTAPVNAGGAGASATYTERMRIDSSGNLLVGNTATPAVGNIGFAFQPSGLMYVTANGDSAVRIKRGSDTGAALRWYGPNSNTEVGNVAVSTTNTTYNTSSDYRLKENIQPMQNGLGVVAQLKPVTYKWKADGSDGQGFIAHELKAVVPECVTGEKDAVDAEGNPVYQGIDTSFLVATLTAAIQELKAELDELKAKVNA